MSKSKEDLEHIVLLNNIEEALKPGPAREVIWHILGLCGIYRDCFTGNAQTNHLEGKRSIGIDILQLIDEADPTAYAELLLEKSKLGKKL
jgi:hypothetical protein